MTKRVAPHRRHFGRWLINQTPWFALLAPLWVVVACLAFVNTPSQWGWSDDSLYQRLAMEIALEGSVRPKFVPPLYPLYLSSVSLFTDPTPETLAWANAVLYGLACLVIVNWAWRVSHSWWATALAACALASSASMPLAWTNYSEPLSYALVYGAFSISVIMWPAVLGPQLKVLSVASHASHGPKATHRRNHDWLIVPTMMAALALAAVFTRTANLTLAALIVPVFVILPFVSEEARDYALVLWGPAMAVAGITIAGYWLSGGVEAADYLALVADHQINGSTSLLFSLYRNAQAVALLIGGTLSPSHASLTAPLLLTVASTLGAWHCAKSVWTVMTRPAVETPMEDPMTRYGVFLTLPVVFALVNFFIWLLLAWAPTWRYYVAVQPVMLVLFALGFVLLRQRRIPWILLLLAGAGDVALDVGSSFLWDQAPSLLSLGTCFLLYGTLIAASQAEEPRAAFLQAAAGIAMLGAFLGHSIWSYGQPAELEPGRRELAGVADWIREQSIDPVVVQSRKPGFVYLESDRRALEPDPWAIHLSGDDFLKAVLRSGAEFVVIDAISWMPDSRRDWLPIIEENPRCFRKEHEVGGTAVYRVVKGMLEQRLSEPNEGEPPAYLPSWR